MTKAQFRIVLDWVGMAILAFLSLCGGIMFFATIFATREEVPYQIQMVNVTSPAIGVIINAVCPLILGAIIALPSSWQLSKMESWHHTTEYVARYAQKAHHFAHSRQW